MTTNKTHYLSNKELYYEIIVSKAKGDLTRKAQNMFILLVKRIHSKMSYQDPSVGEDALHTGYMRIFDNKIWMSFNEDKTRNSFAYFTEITKRALAQGFNQHYKLKGIPNDQPKPHVMSIERTNDGDGMINI